MTVDDVVAAAAVVVLVADVADVAAVVVLVAEKELGNRFWSISRLLVTDIKEAVQPDIAAPHPLPSADPIKMLNKTWAVAVAIIATNFKRLRRQPFCLTLLAFLRPLNTNLSPHLSLSLPLTLPHCLRLQALPSP